ncbi:MAG: hypothetical protein KAR79_00855 [Simkaniaceae bacterium]|nr:hypothetical protein [Simkaniaceae bacterium]
MKSLVIFFILFTALLFSKENEQFTINLKDPVYKDGILSTHEGGVFSSKDIRIQALHIEYKNNVENEEPVQVVSARGNLMITYGERIFIGDTLTYDFIRHTGTITNGQTSIDVWFMGGETITLHPDHSFSIQNAYITTSDSGQIDWKIHSRKMEITKNAELSATNVTFRLLNTPIFWLPAHKSNLKAFNDSPLRYIAKWENGQGPKLSMRYRIYSTENFGLFFRLDLRPKRGFGGALESNFLSKSKRTLFKTKNYLAHDTFFNDNDPNQIKTRYRLQGIFESKNLSESMWTYLTYDKISDRNMPGTFKNDDFELNTRKRTELILRNYQKETIAGINFRPRINSFQAMKEELPTAFLAIKPQVIEKTGVITQNHLKASYLEYVSANELETFIPDYHAMRLDTENKLYRPFNLHFLTLTPLLGFRGIFYNNNPNGDSVLNAFLNYECDVRSPLSKTYKYFTHNLVPYLTYKGISQPSISANDLLIFGIQDGFHRLNEIKIGINNLFYLSKHLSFEPNFSTDLYFYSFYSDHTLSKTVPKAAIDFTWNFSSLRTTCKFGYDIENKVLNHANIHFLWTINQNIAFNIEYKHRSRFDWRKGNHENFILDVTRPVDELVNSPISDGRNLFRTRLELKLTPQWICRLESHTGWGRKDEPSYNEGTIDLITTISSAWKVKVSYAHRVKEGDTIFDPSALSFNFALVTK